MWQSASSQPRTDVPSCPAVEACTLVLSLQACHNQAIHHEYWLYLDEACFCYASGRNNFIMKQLSWTVSGVLGALCDIHLDEPCAAASCAALSRPCRRLVGLDCI